MTEFRLRVEQRVRGLLGLSGVFALVVIVTAIYGRQEEARSGLEDFTQGLQVGIFIGMQLMLLWVIAKLRTALRNEAKLKTLYIEEKDERSLLVLQKANTLSLYGALFLLAGAAIVAGFFHTTVSLTLFAASAVLLLLRIAAKRYYEGKH